MGVLLRGEGGGVVNPSAAAHSLNLELKSLEMFKFFSFNTLFFSLRGAPGQMFSRGEAGGVVDILLVYL